MGQQRTSFLTLFPSLARRGLYVIEDLQTSYDASYGGGPAGKQGTAVDLLKSLVDDLNVEFHRGSLGSGAEIAGIHFYPNIAFIVRG